MSTAIEEGTLEDIDLDRVPPCELRMNYGPLTLPYDEMPVCGRPSKYRVLLYFTCGGRYVRFVCSWCYEHFVVGRLMGCKEHNLAHDLTHWSLT